MKGKKILLSAFGAAFLSATVFSLPVASLANGAVVHNGDEAGESVARHAEGEVLLMYKQSVDAESASAEIESDESVSDVEVIREGIGGGVAVAQVSDSTSVDAAVTELQKFDSVDVVQPNYLYGVADAGSAFSSCDDPFIYRQWGGASISLDAAWKYVASDTQTSVAIMDTGCDLSHEDLSSNIVASYDATSASGVADVDGHGTSVAGIISAEHNNGIGVAGVSKGAGLVPIQVFKYRDGEPMTDTASLISAYEFVCDNAQKYNIKVVNLSVGGKGSVGQDDLLMNAIDKADSQGILTVAAAGNSSASAIVPYDDYPGDYDKCLSVMALGVPNGDSISSENSIAPYSNYNVDGVTEGTANRTKDLCAPGTNIWSTTPNGGYGYKSGTSMAAAAVSGTAAMMFDVNPDLTPAECRTLLEQSATDLGIKGWDQTYGYGKVNAGEAVRAAYLAAGKTEPTDEPASDPGSFSAYSAVYDYDYYIGTYADVKQAFGGDREKTLSHFLNFGMKEGRRGNQSFSLAGYYNRYEDLRRAFGASWDKYYRHYLSNGIKEGRDGSDCSVLVDGQTSYGGRNYAPVYDAMYYAEAYSDLLAAASLNCGNETVLDDAFLVAHYANYGAAEARQANAEFNVLNYKYRNSDLQSAYQNNHLSYVTHYLKYGIREGRSVDGSDPTVSYRDFNASGTAVMDGSNWAGVYDYNYYMLNNSDVADAFKGDPVKLLQHFISFGMSEGRVASADFNVIGYKNRYSDLRAAFGNQYKQYYLHYLSYGIAEGRQGN